MEKTIDLTVSSIKKNQIGLFVIQSLDDLVTTVANTWTLVQMPTGVIKIDKRNGHMEKVDNKMNILKDGIFRINVLGSGVWAEGDDLEFTLFKNGVNINPEGNPIFEGKSNKSILFAMESFIPCLENDYLEIMVRTSVAQTVALDFANFAIEKTVY